MSQSGKKVLDRNNIFGGGGRLIYADALTAKPTALADILNPTSGVLASGWNDIGATDGGINLTRGFDKEEWEVDQVLGAIDEFITKWNMTLETNLAEASLGNLELAWEASEPVLDTGEYTQGIGDPDTVTERMIALIVDKREVAGVGYIRAYVFWIAKLDGADSEHSFVKGEKTLIPLTFSLLADSSEVGESRFGIVLDQEVA